MTILLPVHKISPPQWMRDPDLVRVLDTLNHDDINARMVGGCIRNNYMNKDVHDIDIACKFRPEKSIEILNNAHIKTIPTGIKHGTITAHINGKNFEITTLRQDIKTDGRHADVAFSDSWIEDAKRRDFTINALYADRDGSIYDPLGTGFSDLQNHIVRFIGDPTTRIHEDYLRILRFFRFYAEYHKGEPDAKSIEACIDLKDNIDALSDERICDELFKTLKNNSAPRAVKAMEDGQIFPINDTAATELEILISLQNQLNLDDIPTRFNLVKFNKKYIKNNKLIKLINLTNEFIKSWNGDIKSAIYTYPRDVAIQGLLTLKSTGHTITDIQIANAMSLKIPIFPIMAKDIMHHFKIPEGRDVGIKLKQAEQIWIESDFTLSQDDILNHLKLTAI